MHDFGILVVCFPTIWIKYHRMQFIRFAEKILIFQNLVRPISPLLRTLRSCMQMEHINITQQLITATLIEVVNQSYQAKFVRPLVIKPSLDLPSRTQGLIEFSSQLGASLDRIMNNNVGFIVPRRRRPTILFVLTKNHSLLASIVYQPGSSLGRMVKYLADKVQYWRGFWSRE